MRRPTPEERKRSDRMAMEILTLLEREGHFADLFGPPRTVEALFTVALAISKTIPDDLMEALAVVVTCNLESNKELHVEVEKIRQKHENQFAEEVYRTHEIRLREDGISLTDKI